jgi:hypothetical protein
VADSQEHDGEPGAHLQVKQVNKKQENKKTRKKKTRKKRETFFLEPLTLSNPSRATLLGDFLGTFS